MKNSLLNAGYLKTKASVIFPDNCSRILVVLSFLILLSYWQMGVFLNDEEKSANQLTNFVHGSLHIKEQKIELNPRYYYTLGDIMISPYTHFLPVMALPAAASLFLINSLAGVRLFFSIIWSACFYLLCILVGKETGREKLARNIGLLSIPTLGLNAYISIIRPIDLGAWWEILSLQFFNIIATVASIQIIYHLFRRLFSSRTIGLFAASFILFSTSVAFWGVTAKDHSSVILLTAAAFYSFYMYSIERAVIYRYFAYFCAALNVWVRLDSAVPLILSLLFVDFVFLTRTKRVYNFIKISTLLLVFLTPYFTNNYLNYENPLFPPQYVAQFGASYKGDALVPDLEISNMSRSQQNLLPYLGSWINVFGASSFIGKIYAVFFHFNDKLSTMTAAIFEYSPFLVLSIAGIGSIFVRRKHGNSDKLRHEQESIVNLLFLVYSILLTIIYFKYIGDSARDILPTYDMRYFVTLQITLLYFALKTSGQLIRSYKEKLMEYSALIALLLGISVIFLNNLAHWAGYHNDILLIMKYLGTSGILLMILAYWLTRKGRHPQFMISAIAYSLCIGFFWVLLTVIKVKTAGYLEGGRTMVIPLADYLKNVLEYYILFYRY